jgi:hypothetical protein
LHNPLEYGIIKKSKESIMIRRNATAADFQKWETLATSMSDAELLYAARDCRKVELLWRGHDPMVEGFYSDQASTFGTVLNRRRMSH